MSSLGFAASSIMRKLSIALLAAGMCLCCLCLLTSCSPRDFLSPRNFLTRRLATDLILQSSVFKLPQTYWLATGVVSNKEFNSPESKVLQTRGWVAGTPLKQCPPGVEPAPCWDVELSPMGVDVVRPLIADGTEHGPFAIPVAQRTLEGVTGISKAGSFADVEFTWHWAPTNQLGAALYDGGVRYGSTVGFRKYDDGWRAMSGAARNNQTMEEALRNAEPLSP